MPIHTAIESEKVKYNNHKFFPNHYRLLVVGESGGGKTYLINRLLLTEMLQFDILYLYTPSIKQIEYQLLIKAINAGLPTSYIFGLYANQKAFTKSSDYDVAIDGLAKHKKLLQCKKVIGSDKPAEILNPENMEAAAMQEFKLLPINSNKKDVGKPRVIVLIDDAICSKQNAINQMFVYGRTYGINVIYLTQAFFAVNKNETRTNVNAFILYRQNQDECKRVFTRVNKDKRSFEEFYNLADNCWKKNRGFILITTDPEKGTIYTDGEEVNKEINKIEKELYP